MKEQSNIIVHEYKGFGIPQRKIDSYVDLTILCKANGKQFKHWHGCKSSKLYLQELSLAVGIPTADLIIVGQGNLHTWGHKLIAMEIAKWVSPSFAIWCNQHLLQLIEEGTTYIEPSIPSKDDLALSFDDYLDYLIKNREMLRRDKGLAKITLERIINIL